MKKKYTRQNKWLLLAPVCRESGATGTLQTLVRLEQIDICSIWGQDIRETSTILSDNPTGAWGTGNGDGWAKAGERQKDRVRHQEEDWETWRNAVTAPRLKPLDPPSLLLFPLVSTAMLRIPLAKQHLGCISKRREGTSGVLAPWLMIRRLGSDQWFGRALWNTTTLGAAK